MSGSAPDRTELIRQAVAFLADPQTQASTVEQRIQFLQAKGLTRPEIDEAFRQVSNYSATPYKPQFYGPSQQWDWRDYFITAVVSGAVAYGAVSLFKKYLLPHLQPPNSTAYEQDRDALTAQFDAAEALLKEIQTETAAIRAAVDEQTLKVQSATHDVEQVVAEMKQNETKTRDEMREIRDEVNNIREMLPKMMEKNKDVQTHTLSELQQELKSLKALLLTRSTTPSSPLPSLGRPTIPAWQLASSQPEIDAAVSGKGKEPDTCSNSMFSQLRQAVETFAPPPRRSLDEHERRPLSPSNSDALRKSATSQRSASPGFSSPRTASSMHKSTLEERLRASFSIGEASGSSTPMVSSRTSPMPLAPDQPLSPASVPLPASPQLAPVTLPEPVSELRPLTEAEPDLGPLTEEPETVSPPVEEIPPTSPEITDIDALQSRLKLVEQRFTDVSTSFKRLQAEKRAADTVLRELTPLETFKDSDALRDYIRNIKQKAEISQEELKRANNKLQTQDGRIEELRETHLLESKSQSEQIDHLRKQLEESEALLKAAHESVTQGHDDSAKRQTDIQRLQMELDKSKLVVKEEEEKRVKAISLLKTVRQKLVKAEKEKDDAIKEANVLKERDREDKDRDQGEKNKLLKEMENINAERDKALQGLRAQFDKEMAHLKDRHEKELAAVKGQLELDAVTTKSTYVKDVASKTAQISRLEDSLQALTQDKNNFFDQLQLRQAELESSQSHLESLQSLNTEMQYQLRESQDRIGLLNEELSEAHREQESQSRTSAVSSIDVGHMLAAAEAKHELKLAEMKRVINNLENERNDSEAEWSRKLREKSKETEDLRRVLGSAAKTNEEEAEVVTDLKAEIAQLQQDIQAQQNIASELRTQIATEVDAQTSAKEHETMLTSKIAALERDIEEVKAREAQLRVNNKTLREELRKVQSSAALLEKTRNPGVGYWTGRDSTSEPMTSPGSPMSRSSTPVLASPSSSKQEEEVNLEYLRNVILQFLEHKEMRPNLVKVLSIILHFTPQETRRLVAKV
ncbi:hypothetical protein C8J56DRAFT_1011641 [Mycena floridula]|nr:hypothetical protein C8J56DRAFT_1011641 [Mycena floridula]